MSIIAFQPTLRPALPCVHGPIEYHEQCAVFIRIDEIIKAAGLEKEFIALAVKEHAEELAKLSPKQVERFVRYSALALRCNIARINLGLSLREFTVRAADSPLLQWFLETNEVDKIKSPSKSAADRFSRWLSDGALRQMNDKLITLLAAPAPQGQAAPLGLEKPVVCDEVFFDATCLKVNIHFPVDWVLLRDGTRTLMKATVLIRTAGLKERMPQEPLEFLSDMNSLCMKMSAQGRGKDSKRGRKKVLREMKTLQKRITAHARAHRDALETRRAETDLSEGQARVILARIDSVLEQIPAAIKQAHERIIGGRQVKTKDKILSLYDQDINVIVRGKAGAQVEFGNKLLLGEMPCGVIADYKLFADNPAEPSLLKPGVERVVKLGLPLRAAWSDRGLMSAANEKALEKLGIKSGLCPRNPAELARRLEEEPGFREGLKRRGSTEARIGIFKNVFLGEPLRAKSIEHREQAVGNAVLAHNLWVLARLPKAKAQEAKKPGPKRQSRAAEAARRPKAA